MTGIKLVQQRKNAEIQYAGFPSFSPDAYARKPPYADMTPMFIGVGNASQEQTPSAMMSFVSPKRQPNAFVS